MTHNSRWIVARTALLWILCAGLAYGASDGKKVKFNALITGRDGENLTVKNLPTVTWSKLSPLPALPSRRV